MSVAFSSLPGAVAQGVQSAAERAGIARKGKKVKNITVRRAKVADRAKKLGKYKPARPTSKRLGTRGARNHVLVLDKRGTVPLRALPPELSQWLITLARRGGGSSGLRGPAGPRGLRGLRGATGARGADGLLGPQGPAGSVSNVVVRTAESTVGTVLGELRTATATCQAGEKLVGGAGYAGTGILSPVTSLVSGSLIQFVSTAGGVPVADDTSGASSFSAQGVVGASDKVFSQAFCATG